MTRAADATGPGPMALIAVEQRFPPGQRILVDELADQMLQFMSNAVPGSRAIFTYIREDFIEGRDLAGQVRLYNRYVRAGAWRFGLAPDRVGGLAAGIWLAAGGAAQAISLAVGAKPASTCTWSHAGPAESVGRRWRRQSVTKPSSIATQGCRCSRPCP
jgi:hypothetical protein